MQIYAVGDIHGKKEHMAALFSVAHEYKPDLIVAAGDLTQFFNWRTTMAQLDSLPAKLLAIRGNTDFKQVESQLNKAQNMTLLGHTPHSIQGFSFVGASGTLVLPFGSRIGFKEKEKLAQFPPMNAQTVLVVHPPPKGCLDKVANKISSGSRNLKAFIEKANPGLVLCGHIHEQAGKALINNTLVVNCSMSKKSAGALIDLEPGQAPKVNFLHH